MAASAAQALGTPAPPPHSAARKCATSKGTAASERAPPASCYLPLPPLLLPRHFVSAGAGGRPALSSVFLLQFCRIIRLLQDVPPPLHAKRPSTLPPSLSPRPAATVAAVAAQPHSHTATVDRPPYHAYHAPCAHLVVRYPSVLPKYMLTCIRSESQQASDAALTY